MRRTWAALVLVGAVMACAPQPSVAPPGSAATQTAGRLVAPQPTADTRVHAAFDIPGPERPVGKKRNLPDGLTDDQCRALGRLDAEADRDARVAPSRPQGDATLAREPGGPLQIRVNMWPTADGLRCGQAYGEGYQSVYVPG